MKSSLRFVVSFSFLLLGSVLSLPAAVPPGKVACVGDSITFGSGTSNPAWTSYPSLLGRMLGKPWEVRNFGVSGATLLNAGDRPYQKEGAFQAALAFQPDAVVIMLGTNDTKPQNWKFKENYEADYRDLVSRFKALPTKPVIFLCRPVPAIGVGNFGITEEVMKEVLPLVEKVAKADGAQVIDMHAALSGRDDLYKDRVHPVDGGAEIMAKTVYHALTGKAFSGPIPSESVSEWNGYKQLQFSVASRTCRLVVPSKPAKGNPWIWRTEFFGHEPQADLALLERGFHVAYIDLTDMYGSPKSLDLMDAFYDHVRKANGLAEKTTLFGFSRGGLFALNWAARHPERVAALYLDAPVCDFKSWPAGKGKGKGSPADWEKLKKAYGFSEEEAIAWTLNPVDNLKPLAASKIPILSVCGDADTGVPLAENTAIVQERYKALGGPIEVILKPGVEHHPHSLKDPAPIVAFVLKSTGQ